MTVTIESGGPLPASLDGLKAYLRISTADEDALLTDLIRAAGDVAERFLGQLLIERGVEEVMDARCDWRALAVRPVTSILSVAGLSTDGEEIALSVGDYALDIDGNGDGWVRLANGGGPGAPLGRICVRYRAGIADEAGGLPDAIRHGIIRLAGDYHALREGVEPQPPASVAALWRPWRRMVLR